MKKFFLKVLLFVVAPLLMAFIFFVFSGLVMEKTDSVSFCTSCHSMEPMHTSYKTDVHAGNNKTGVVAKCTDCHLPHNGTVRKLWVKTKMGINDLMVEKFGDPKKVDWKLKWIRREEFTFDSGCIKCHGKMEIIDAANPDAAHAHKFYSEEKKHSCTLCHRHIGHKSM